MPNKRDDLFDFDPITLGEASRLLLHGIVSVSALRSEIRKDTLSVERIGKNLYTTPAAIREMREKCRVMQNPRDPTSGKTAKAKSGSSGTESTPDELAAWKATLTALKNGSLSVARRNRGALDSPKN